MHNLQPRLLMSVLLAGLVAFLLPPGFDWLTRALCLWDTAMLCFLGLTWAVMLRATPNMMRRKAQQQDIGGLTILSLITAAACASVLAIGFLLHNSQGISSSLLILHLGLSVTTIIGSWLLVHTIFALHYAHGYYLDNPQNLSKEDTKGLSFPGRTEPDYWDFFYFSFVIGMTSQVSDVQIESSSMRRLALLHGVLSFFFNTTIVAMSINIIAGLI